MKGRDFMPWCGETIEDAPKAFLGLFCGGNLGKRVVCVAQEPYRRRCETYQTYSPPSQTPSSAVGSGWASKSLNT